MLPLNDYNTMQLNAKKKLILLVTLLLIGGCVSVTHAQTDKVLTPDLGVSLLDRRLLTCATTAYPKGLKPDSLNYLVPSHSHIDTTNYIKEVYKQVIEDLEAGDSSDTVKVLQETYINDLLQENAEKDKTIKNRDDTIFEFRGQVLALKREVVYKETLVSTLSKEAKFTRKCLAGAVVLWVVVEVSRSLH